MAKPNKSRIFFHAILFVFALFIVVTSLAMYTVDIVLFPLIVGVATVIMTAILIVHEIRPIPLLGALDISLMGVSPDTGLEETGKQVFTRRVLAIMTWILGFFIIVLVLGFNIGTVIFTLSFLKIEGRVSWLKAGIVTVIIVGLNYGIFEVGMPAVGLFKGIVFGEVLPDI